MYENRNLIFFNDALYFKNFFKKLELTRIYVIFYITLREIENLETLNSKKNYIMKLLSF